MCLYQSHLKYTMKQSTRILLKTTGPTRFNLLAIRKNTIYSTYNDNDKLSLLFYSLGMWWEILLSDEHHQHDSRHKRHIYFSCNNNRLFRALPLLTNLFHVLMKNWGDQHRGLILRYSAEVPTKLLAHIFFELQRFSLNTETEIPIICVQTLKKTMTEQLAAVPFNSIIQGCRAAVTYWYRSGSGSAPLTYGLGSCIFVSCWPKANKK